MNTKVIKREQVAETKHETLIIITGNSINPTVKKLRELLGGDGLVDIRGDSLASVWGGNRTRLGILKKGLMNRLIKPLLLGTKMSKYKQVICYFNSSGYLLGFMNQLFPKHLRPRTVWIGFIPPPKPAGFKGWLKEFITYRAVQGFDSVVCFTKPHHKVLKERFPKIKDKLTYVRWWANSDELNKFRSEGEGGYIFCGGRTNRDFDTFVTAVNSLKTPVKLVIGQEVQLPEVLPPNLEVYRDIPFHEFYTVMGNASVVVIPLFDPEIPSGSDVLGQAMQMGRPVVVTNLSGMDDYVVDGYNALLVKPHDPEDLRQKLELLMASPEQRNRIRQAGFETVSKHNANTFAEDLARVITEDS